MGDLGVILVVTGQGLALSFNESTACLRMRSTTCVPLPPVRKALPTGRASGCRPPTMRGAPDGRMACLPPLPKAGGRVRGSDCSTFRMERMDSSHGDGLGLCDAPRAGVESGSGRRQPDGPGRTRESIPSYIPTIFSPGSISMESPKAKSFIIDTSITNGFSEVSKPAIHDEIAQRKDCIFQPRNNKVARFCKLLHLFLYAIHFLFLGESSL